MVSCLLISCFFLRSFAFALSGYGLYFFAYPPPEKNRNACGDFSSFKSWMLKIVCINLCLLIYQIQYYLLHSWNMGEIAHLLFINKVFVFLIFLLAVWGGTFICLLPPSYYFYISCNVPFNNVNHNTLYITTFFYDLITATVSINFGFKYFETSPTDLFIPGLFHLGITCFYIPWCWFDIMYIWVFHRMDIKML